MQVLLACWCTTVTPRTAVSLSARSRLLLLQSWVMPHLQSAEGAARSCGKHSVWVQARMQVCFPCAVAQGDNHINQD